MLSPYRSGIVSIQTGQNLPARLQNLNLDLDKPVVNLELKNYSAVEESQLKEVLTSLFRQLNNYDGEVNLIFSTCPMEEKRAAIIREVITDFLGGNCSISSLTLDFRNHRLSTYSWENLAPVLTTPAPLSLQLIIDFGNASDFDTDDKRFRYRFPPFIAAQIKSPNCIKNLHIKTQEISEDVEEALQHNISCTLELPLHEGIVKAVYLLNERNILIKRYPIHQEEILFFCRAQHLYGMPDSVQQGDNVFLIHSNKDLPEDILAFFNKVYEASLDSIPGIGTLNDSSGTDFIQHDTCNLTFLQIQKMIKSEKEFEQLCVQVIQNIEFTGFLKPQIQETGKKELTKLLILTATRNSLMKAWSNKEIENSCLQKPQLFTIKLLEYLANNKSLPAEFIKNVLLYCGHAFDTFPDANERLFNLVIKTGILPLVEIFYHKFSSSVIDLIRDNEECRYPAELFYVVAIQSGSKKIISYLNTVYKELGDGFISPETIKRLANAKSDVTHAHLILLEELLKEKELDDIRRAIAYYPDRLKHMVATIQKHNLNKTKLIKMAIIAGSQNSSISFIAKLNLPDSLNLINFDKFSDKVFILLATAGVPGNEELLERISRSNALALSSEQLTLLIPYYSKAPKILATLIARFPDAFNAGHLYLIVKEAIAAASPCTHLQELLKLPVETLLQDDFLEYLYLLSRGTEHDQLGIQHFPFQEILFRKTVSSFILKQNSVLMLALLAAHGYLLKPDPAMDYRRVILLAIAYAADKNTTRYLYDVLQALDPKVYPKEKIHELFAIKLKNTSLTEADFNKKEIDKKDAIIMLQGAVRTRNRTKIVYPGLLNPSQNSYLFWMQEKPKLRIRALSNEFRLFSVPYLNSHRKNPSDKFLFSLIPRTFQHVLMESNLSNIVKTGYLLSEEARIEAGMSGFPTINEQPDRNIKDSLLVCTAPLNSVLRGSKAKITIKLSELPTPYLQHCIVKLGDYASRTREIKCDITPTISLTLLPGHDVKKSNYEFGKSVYQFTDLKKGLRYQLAVPGENEIFHGIAGFREALMHVLCVIDGLPDTEIKNDIRIYFEKMSQENRLNEHLDKIFKQLFRYMEIDFQRGLPLSPTYIESITVDEEIKINLFELIEFAEKGELDQLIEQVEKYPDLLGQPFFIRAILEKVTPYYFQRASAMFEEKFPAAYVEAFHCMEIHHQYLPQLKGDMNKLALEPLLSPKYDLGKLLNMLEQHLNPKERQRLMNKYKDVVSEITRQVGFIYENFTFAGGNSKLIEVFTNPALMGLMTGKNKNILAAILAFEVEAGLTHTSTVTFIPSVISQRTKAAINISLGSILKQGLKIPASFIEITPVNRTRQLSEQHTIREHIKQRYYFRHIYQNLERSLIELMQNYALDIQEYEILPESNEIRNYPESFKETGASIPDDYAKNPKLTEEVNRALTDLLIFLKFDTPPAKEELVERLLTSTAILDFKFSHLLFDTTHFAIALKGNGILKIKLSEGDISFAELIQACIEKIDSAKNSDYAMMAQQLITKIQWLKLELEAQ